MLESHKEIGKTSLYDMEPAETYENLIKRLESVRQLTPEELRATNLIKRLERNCVFLNAWAFGP